MKPVTATNPRTFTPSSKPLIRQQEFLYFCRLQLETGDYDAHIPLLKGLVQFLKLRKEEALWLGLLYMAYYSEGSMWYAFKRPGVPERRQTPPLDLPITTQRRNLYGGRLARHFADLYQVKRLTAWLTKVSDWSGLLEQLHTVYGNGRWACYTTAELLTHLGPINIQPSTFEVMESTGPRRGLTALGLEVTEEACRYVLEVLTEAGITDQPSVVESLLCDWGGMNKGTFYAGRNIDRQQGRILQVEERKETSCPTLWKMRRQVFPANTLGELQGWSGIDKQRLKVYRDSGRVLAPDEERISSYPSRKGRT